MTHSAEQPLLPMVQPEVAGAVANAAMGEDGEQFLTVSMGWMRDENPDLHDTLRGMATALAGGDEVLADQMLSVAGLVYASLRNQIESDRLNRA